MRIKVELRCHEKEIYKHYIKIIDFHNYLLLLSFFLPLIFSHTGEPLYPRPFYLRIRIFKFEILLKRAKFLIKMCPFIFEFSIHGPK
jgi:hypothetical protein